MNILLIDDSPEMGIVLKKALEPYNMEHAFNIQEAHEIMRQKQIDLFLIDVTLPDGNGFDFCTELSTKVGYEHIPRILITGKTETSEKVFGLYSGADDYVTKPFSVQELKARIDARLRNQATIKKLIKIDNLEFDTEAQRCSLIQGEQKLDLQLTPTEYRILFILAQKEGELITREKLASINWKAHGLNIEKRGIDTHVAHLRKKLGPARDKLVSVYNKGYMLKKAG